MKLTFPSTLYTSHSSAAQPLRHRKKIPADSASAPSGHTRPRRSPAPVPPVAAQILSDHVRHQAAHIRQMILPLPDTQLQVDAPALFPRGGTPWGLFGAEPFAGGLPSGWAATPNTARYSAQRQKPCISPSAPFLRSPPSCGVSNYCYFNRHSDENQADGPIVSCIFTE